MIIECKHGGTDDDIVSDHSYVGLILPSTAVATASCSTVGVL